MIPDREFFTNIDIDKNLLGFFTMELPVGGQAPDVIPNAPGKRGLVIPGMPMGAMPPLPALGN